ncbi:MAG TPA: hypothetical protein VF897_12245, partial [Roseiflexaceae bacterium]
AFAVCPARNTLICMQMLRPYRDDSLSIDVLIAARIIRINLLPNLMPAHPAAPSVPSAASLGVLSGAHSLSGFAAGP